MCLELHFFTWSYSLNLDSPPTCFSPWEERQFRCSLGDEELGISLDYTVRSSKGWGVPEAENHHSNEDKRSACPLKQEKAPETTFQNQE